VNTAKAIFTGAMTAGANGVGPVQAKFAKMVIDRQGMGYWTSSKVLQGLVDMKGYGGIFFYPWGDNNSLGFFVEVWVTFLFALTFLIVSHPKTHHSTISALNGGTVAITLAILIAVAGRFTGGCLNPAVGLGANLMSKIFYKNPLSMGKIWIYMLGPWTGAILAGFFYNFFHTPITENVTILFTSEGHEGVASHKGGDKFAVNDYEGGSGKMHET
jgi:glycerol uptake facilitator-like aquaporin